MSFKPLSPSGVKTNDSRFGNAEHAILQDVRQTLLQGLRTAAGSLSLDDMVCEFLKYLGD